MPTSNDIDLANRLAEAAGAAIRPLFRGQWSEERKADRSYVTEADRAAETMTAPPSAATQTMAAATAMALLIVSVFWHARLGLQVLIEDYLHDAGTKFGVLSALNLATIGGGAFAIFSVAALAFGGQA